MSLYLWLALGGAIGTLARFGVAEFTAQHWGDSFPWGTLIINVGGSFLIGFFATLTNSDGRYTLNHTTRHFVMTGIFGGFTTFSSFSLQTLHLARDGDNFLDVAKLFGARRAFEKPFDLNRLMQAVNEELAR